jgi:hypothetical protein
VDPRQPARGTEVLRRGDEAGGERLGDGIDDLRGRGGDLQVGDTVAVVDEDLDRSVRLDPRLGEAVQVCAPGPSVRAQAVRAVRQRERDGRDRFVLVEPARPTLLVRR